jgi:hypothetical protein
MMGMALLTLGAAQSIVETLSELIIFLVTK